MCIVTVGNLPFSNVQADAVESFGRAVNEQLFAVGRELGRVSEGLVFPDSVDGHCVQIQHIKAAFSERALRQIFIGSGKKQEFYIIGNIIQRSGLAAESELLRKPRFEKISVNKIPVAVVRLTVINSD